MIRTAVIVLPGSGTAPEPLSVTTTSRSGFLGLAVR